MKSQRKLKALILDYDGVIVDSMGRQEQAWRNAAREVKVPRAVEENLVGNLYSGRSADRMFRGLAISSTVRTKLRVVKDRIWENECARVPLFSGAGTEMRRLASLCRIGIATTADRRHVETVLTREGIRDCIVAITTDRDVPRPKPYPDMLLELINGPLAAAPDSSLMVGDSDTDRQMARAAAVEFLLFDAAQNGPRAEGMTAVSWNDLGRFVVERMAV